MKRLMFVVAVVLCVAMAQIAVADDIQPPPWRGQWSTTSQVWEFLTSQQPNNPIKPDGPAPGGQPPLPSTELRVDPISGGGWIPSDPLSGRVGIWPLSGMMDVIVDNHNPPNEFKLVWVQITWRPQDTGEYPIIDPVSQPGYQTTTPILRLPGAVPLENGWFESTYTWQIYPNPPDERFYITGTIDVDELVIDTWCIPEPATMILLAAGLFGIRKLKR